MVRMGCYTATKTLEEKDRLSELSMNPLYNSFRGYLKSSVTGLTYDSARFINAARKADSIVRSDPDILTTFHIQFDDLGRDNYVTKRYDPSNLVHRCLYYRANPWRFAYDILGRTVLNMTTPAGTSFKYFIRPQKQFLRDILDPRLPLLIASCNRGGSKTWLCGLAIAVMEFIAPKTKITILGGSKDQSLNLYNYFKIFVENSELKTMLEGEPLQTLTRFSHGGYVRALPASEKSVRGPRPDVLFLDETCEAESRVIKSALPQVLTAANMKIVATSTPHKMVHLFRDWWIYPEYGFKKHHWTAFDCPWISKKNIEALKRTYTKEEYNIEVLGEFAAITGSVWDPDIINYAARNTDLPLMVPNVKELYLDVEDGFMAQLRPIQYFHGLDWGYEHPSVLVSGFMGNDGHMYITHDFEMKRWQDKDIMEYVFEKVKGYRGDVFADSASIFQNNNLREKLTQLNVSCIPVVYRAVKMRMVKNLGLWLENRRIDIIKDDCEKLVTQMLNYSYKEGTDKPEKVDDDHVDALMNLMWGARGYKGIDLEVGTKLQDGREFLEPGAVGSGNDIALTPMKWK